MDVEKLPLVNQIVSIGPDNRLFDGLLVSGPLIVVLIVLVGRNMATFGLAVGYLLLFVLSVLYAGIQHSSLGSGS